MHSGMYRDCIDKQKQLEREESNGDNAENELDGENAEKEEAEKLDKNKPTRKRKRKQMKVYICVQFLTGHTLFLYLRTYI